ncbi:MAG TPA: sulfotransferase family 2 domain-containing protein [Aequorivita sp.]|jgi:hypothetical protein|nr:sulfotransferase family 2 domain-containing protein [Aequorivita sp.]
MYYFVHIEKCAGTTLHEILALTFLRYVHITKNHFGGNEKKNDLSLSEYQKIKKMLPSIIGGHNIRPYLNFIEPSNCFTFFRNPIDRYISQYNHDHERGFSPSFDHFLNRSYSRNFMVQKIAGEENFEKAKLLLAQFMFVGDVDNFTQSIERLSKILKVRFYGRTQNHNVRNNHPNYLTFEQLSLEQRELARSQNELDIKLYNYFIEKNSFANNDSNQYSFREPSEYRVKLINKLNKIKKNKVNQIRKIN